MTNYPNLSLASLAFPDLPSFGMCALRAAKLRQEAQERVERLRQELDQARAALADAETLVNSINNPNPQ